MGKTLVLYKDKDKMTPTKPELLYDESFFDYFMNSNLKLSKEQSVALLKESLPKIIKIFNKDSVMKSYTELLLLYYKLELDSDQSDIFDNLENQDEQLHYMFRELILRYQDDVKNKGFEEALNNNSEFFITMRLNYKELDLETVYKIMEIGQQCVKNI